MTRMAENCHGGNGADTKNICPFYLKNRQKIWKLQISVISLMNDFSLNTI